MMRVQGCLRVGLLRFGGCCCVLDSCSDGWTMRACGHPCLTESRQQVWARIHTHCPSENTVLSQLEQRELDKWETEVWDYITCL